MERFKFSFNIDGHCDIYYKITHPEKLLHLVSPFEHRLRTRGCYWCNFDCETRTAMISCLDKTNNYKIVRAFNNIDRPHIDGTLIRKDRIRMKGEKDYLPRYINKGVYLVFRIRCEGNAEYDIESKECFQNKKLQLRYYLGHKRNRAYGRMDVLASEIEYDGKTILPSLIQTNEPSTPFGTPYAEVFIIEK